MNFTYFDFYICFGEDESLDFVTKLETALHSRNLTSYKRSVTPIQKNREEIIAQSGNFLFIMSPSAHSDPQCLQELTFAHNLNKRIIPIHHIYDLHDHIPPLIQKENWVNPFGKSANSTLDSFEPTLKEIISIIETDEDHIKSHTYWYYRAHFYNQHGKEYLLQGSDRYSVNEWLKKHKDSQPSPLQIHYDYVCESKKYAHDMFADVFILGFQSDHSFINSLQKRLHRDLQTTNSHALPHEAATIEQSVYDQIDRSAIVILPIRSDQTLDHIFCQTVDYISTSRKKVVALILDEVGTINPKNRWPSIDIYLLHKDNSTDKNFDDFFLYLREKRRFHKVHRNLHIKAKEWLYYNCNENYLLPTINLQKYLNYFNSEPELFETYPLTPLQEQYTTACNKSSGPLKTYSYICCHEKDKDFVYPLLKKLRERGLYLSSTLDFYRKTDGNEISNFISQCANFVYIMTPQSLLCPNCKDELNQAIQLKKKVVPLIVLPVDTTQYPSNISPTSVIHLLNGPIINKPNYSDDNIDVLYKSIDEGSKYTHYHIMLQQKAKEWDHNGKLHEHLMNPAFYRKIKNAQHKLPELTELQKEYIQKSNTYIQSLESSSVPQKQNNSLGSLAFFLIVLALISGFIYKYSEVTSFVSLHLNRINPVSEEVIQLRNENTRLQQEIQKLSSQHKEEIETLHLEKRFHQRYINDLETVLFTIRKNKSKRTNYVLKKEFNNRDLNWITIQRLHQKRQREPEEQWDMTKDIVKIREQSKGQGTHLMLKRSGND